MSSSLMTETCGICKSTIYIQKKSRCCTLSCSSRHQFHDICIQSWFKDKQSCPLCKEYPVYCQHSYHSVKVQQELNYLWNTQQTSLKQENRLLMDSYESLKLQHEELKHSASLKEIIYVQSSQPLSVPERNTACEKVIIFSTAIKDIHENPVNENKVDIVDSSDEEYDSSSSAGNIETLQRPVARPVPRPPPGTPPSRRRRLFPRPPPRNTPRNRSSGSPPPYQVIEDVV